MIVRFTTRATPCISLLIHSFRSPRRKKTRRETGPETPGFRSSIVSRETSGSFASLTSFHACRRLNRQRCSHNRRKSTPRGCASMAHTRSAPPHTTVRACRNLSAQRAQRDRPGGNPGEERWLSIREIDGDSARCVRARTFPASREGDGQSPEASRFMSALLIRSRPRAQGRRNVHRHFRLWVRFARSRSLVPHTPCEGSRRPAR